MTKTQTTKRRIPMEAARADSPAAQFIAARGIDAYRRHYAAGWTAGRRSADSAKFGSGSSSMAWEDGYLDAASGREKWHTLTCERHDNTEDGCGTA